MLIPRPSYPSGFLFQDEDMETIANYLKTEINLTFNTALNGKNAVNYISTENTLTLPLIDKVYPLLKVFRTTEKPEYPIGGVNPVTITIVYVLAYQVKQRANGLTAYVAQEIVRLLQNSNIDDVCPFHVDLREPIVTEYNIANENTDIIYSYAKLTCVILSQ